MSYEEFPQLDAIRTQLDNDIKRYDSEIKELRDNPRYAENETERRYLLQELADKREQTLADAETQYTEEIELIEMSLADRAFSQPEASDEEISEVQATTQQIKTQVTMSVNPVNTLSLLSVRARNMTDIEKQAL